MSRSHSEIDSIEIRMRSPQSWLCDRFLLTREQNPTDVSAQGNRFQIGIPYSISLRIAQRKVGRASPISQILFDHPPSPGYRAASECLCLLKPAPRRLFPQTVKAAP